MASSASAPRVSRASDRKRVFSTLQTGRPRGGARRSAGRRDATGSVTPSRDVTTTRPGRARRRCARRGTMRERRRDRRRVASTPSTCTTGRSQSATMPSATSRAVVEGGHRHLLVGEPHAVLDDGVGVLAGGSVDQRRRPSRRRAPSGIVPGRFQSFQSPTISTCASRLAGLCQTWRPHARAGRGSGPRSDEQPADTAGSATRAGRERERERERGPRASPRASTSRLGYAVSVTHEV